MGINLDELREVRRVVLPFAPPYRDPWIGSGDMGRRGPDLSARIWSWGTHHFRGGVFIQRTPSGDSVGARSAVQGSVRICRPRNSWTRCLWPNPPMNQAFVSHEPEWPWSNKSRHGRSAAGAAQPSKGKGAIVNIPLPIRSVSRFAAIMAWGPGPPTAKWEGFLAKNLFSGDLCGGGLCAAIALFSEFPPQC